MVVDWAVLGGGGGVGEGEVELGKVDEPSNVIETATTDG